jgi:hypothetical protein
MLKEVDACYTPASFAAADDLANKAKFFDQRKGTVRIETLRQMCKYELIVLDTLAACEHLSQ